jgi:hypothetical protein
MKPENEIKNELLELQSTMAEMPSKLPFSVPDDYFKDLPKATLQHVKAFESLSEENTYALPDNYFETLPAKVLASAKQAKKPTTIIAILGWQSKTIRWSAAAVFLLMVSLSSVLYISQRNKNPEVILSKILLPELNEYAQQNIDDYDVYMHINTLVSKDNTDNYTKHLSTSEIEQYLEETDFGQKSLD